MTGEHTGIVTGSKLSKDPNALKIASFRTKEGVWAEFCQKAESIGLTATDVIKAAMEQFINGTYSPMNIHTAVSTLSLSNHDDVMTRIDTAIDNRVLPLIESATARVVANDKALEEMVKVNIEPLADLLAELETYTQSQFAAVREELKKPLAIAR